MSDAQVQCIQSVQGDCWQSFYHEFGVDNVLIRYREVKQVSILTVLLEDCVEFLYLDST